MKLYTDGARDDSVAGVGWEITLSDGSRIEDSRYITGTYTSLEAEYFALLDGLRNAKRYDESDIEVFTDCRPLIDKMLDQSQDDWEDRRAGCRRLLNKFESWELEWTPRSSNEKADRLAYEALELGRSYP